ncbi:hypothetical protein SAMD00019534_065940 [Acytostelium subglobosum LB1]|uniref:hypothetical protein n=1 Tax=Acytostelium subglobosum LB1 TaxID=1410327 RepID=UPI000644BABA|nr:hypothetical protein SAMD00019534_065940 [Acytostelium subglobosum LB1]GAM23419.1 hypothetical protein SAMD00019534_065940 [Acytostelium subglobosum LB1]|eukprot:XP_012753868.1 hypothetical protein SAMD00019534_065940 [Acytostelium subglobosum LB1]
MAFVIQNSEQGPKAFRPESAGCYLGYHGIDNSIAIEFDTYQHGHFGEVNSNHISVQSNGTKPNSADHKYSLGQATPLARLNDYQLHHVVVTYNPYVPENEHQMTVGFDGIDIIKCKVNLAELLNLENNDEAYVGFTAATGMCHQEHLVYYCNIDRLLP